VTYSQEAHCDGINLEKPRGLIPQNKSLLCFTNSLPPQVSWRVRI
jgi:hypothetical protein